MKKKLFSLLLSLVMIFSLLPTAAFAGEEGAEGAGAATTANSLPEAVDKTITLTEDVALAETFTVGNGTEVTIDLAGKSITAPDKKNAIAVDGGNLTVIDSTAKKAPTVADGQVTYTSGTIQSSTTAIFVQKAGSLHIKSGSVKSSANVPVGVWGNTTAGETDTSEVNSIVTIDDGYLEGREGAAVAQGRGATLNINGGVLVATDNFAVGGNGTIKERYDGGTTINIKGGKLISHIQSNGYIACGIYHPQAGTLNISGGEIYADGGVGILMRGGTLNMTGGTVNATGTATGKVGDSTIIGGCYGIQVDAQSKYYDNANTKVKIQSGTVTSATNDVLSVVGVDTDSTARIAVTGGTFSSDPKAYLSSEGYTVLKTTVDGTDSFEVAKAKDISFTVSGIAEGEGAPTPVITVKLGNTAIDAKETPAENATATYTLAVGKTYDYTVTADGYKTQSGTVKVTDSTTTVPVTMTKTDNTYAADFTVTDGADNAIVGAKISVTTPAAGETQASTKEYAVDANGKCTVTGLERNVAYTYVVKADGYTDTTSANLPSAAGQDKVAVTVSMTAKTYTATIAVKDGDNAITDARITVTKSDGTPVTAENGVYTLNQPEVATYTVEKNDYVTATGTIKYNSSVTTGPQTVPVNLTKVNHDYTVTFNVTGLAKDVTPTITVKQGQEAVSATTDKTYTLQNNKAYTYTVEATGYNTVTGQIAQKDSVAAQAIGVSMVKTDNTYSVTFKIATENATVIVKDANGAVVLAEADGSYKLDNTQTYTYSVSKDDFVSKTGSIDKKTDTSALEIKVDALTAVNHDYTMTFNVSGLASSETPTIKVMQDQTEVTATTDTTYTLKNNQAYSYTVTAEGYNTVEGSIGTKGVAVDASISVAMVKADIILITAPVVDTSKLDEIADPVAKSEMVKAAQSTEIPQETANAVAASADKANLENKVSDEDMNAAKAAAGIADGAESYTFVQTYIAVTPTKYTEDTAAGIVTMELDITPMAQVVVSSQEDPAALDEGTNAAKAGAAQELTVTTPVTVTLTVPSALLNVTTGDYVYITHKGDTYRSTVAANGTISFVNKNGFSLFALSNNEPSNIKAYIKETGAGYASLADALKAIENGQTIQLLANDSAQLNSSDATFKVELAEGITATIKDGYGKEVTPVDDVYTFTSDNYKPSGSNRPGGGGGSSSSTYTLTFETNGGTKIDKVSKSSGAKIDLSDYKTTRSGYTFDGWYSDKDLTDKVTSITLNSSTTVYAKWTEGSAMTFNDVNTGDWFYDAVKYAFDNSLMNGISSSQFGPNQSTTRGMIVTMLWRLEKEPSAAASSFTDVDANQYYAKAINWAAANNVVTGVDAKTFAPNASITREQLATILYRFAQYKSYNVSASKDLTFPDSNTVSAYAVDAMKWAVGAGLVNGTDGQLQPTGGATRAQVATMFMRFIQNIVK